MTDSNYIKIFTGNFIIVQRISEALHTVNIIPVIKDESESGRLAGFGASIQGEQEIYINKDEIVKATHILEGIKEAVSQPEAVFFVFLLYKIVVFCIFKY